MNQSNNHQPDRGSISRSVDQSTTPGVPVCLCRAQRQNPAGICTVAFHQTVLGREMSHLDKLLLRKQEQLERLELSPATDLTLQQFRYRESLRQEIKLLASLLIQINNLGEAYVDETGRMAGLYWQLWTNDQLKQKLIGELRNALGKAQKHIEELKNTLEKAHQEEDFWVNLYHHQIKKRLTNHV